VGGLVTGIAGIGIRDPPCLHHSQRRSGRILKRSWLKNDLLGDAVNTSPRSRNRGSEGVGKLSDSLGFHESRIHRRNHPPSVLSSSRIREWGGGSFAFFRSLFICPLSTLCRSCLTLQTFLPLLPSWSLIPLSLALSNPVNFRLSSADRLDVA
jgi:hypothetical protein